MSGHDFHDYLNRQQQAQAAAQRLADITRDPEREAADLEQVVEEAATDEIAALAEQATTAEENLTTVVTETRDLRKQIAAGSLSVADAKEALIALRQRHGQATHSMKVLRPRYDRAVEAAKDPAARRDHLIQKYGL